MLYRVVSKIIPKHIDKVHTHSARLFVDDAKKCCTRYRRVTTPLSRSIRTDDDDGTK